MALQTVKCINCWGCPEDYLRVTGETCYRCWGVGEIEVQRGPQDPDDEVSHRPRVGSNWAIFARWEQEREQQG